MLRRVLLPGGLVLLSLLSAACAPERVSLAGGTREYVASDYPLVLKRWTRTESLLAISELDDLLTATATFESWDFRWAYVIRYANDYRLTVDQRRLLLEKTLRETKDAHRFYVALYGASRHAADLHKPDSTWVVRLIDDRGNETAPASLEHIAKPSALERTYFPYTTVWRNVYRITFPRRSTDGRSTIARDATWLGLRFTGVQGNQELRFYLDPGDHEATLGPSSEATTTPVNR